jgi:hypothetical protein
MCVLRRDRHQRRAVLSRITSCIGCLVGDTAQMSGELDAPIFGLDISAFEI